MISGASPGLRRNEGLHLEAIRETPVIRTERVDCKGVASAKHAKDA